MTRLALFAFKLSDFPFKPDDWVGNILLFKRALVLLAARLGNGQNISGLLIVAVD
jgi:hypothetical protein